MDPLKRPHKDESEEDILKQQEQFLALKERGVDLKPAASVVRKQKRDLVKGVNESLSGQMFQETNSVSIADNHSTSFNVDFDIIERDVTIRESPFKSVEAQQSFPKVLKLDSSLNVNGDSKLKKVSLFRQQIKKEKSRVIPDSQLSVKSYVIDGSGLLSSDNVETEKIIKDIHESNLELLRGMSKEEIETERQKYLTELDPKIVEFLINKRKRKMKGKEITESVPESNQNMKKVEKRTNNSESVDYVPISVEEAKKNKWLHMDNLEKDKLEWMKPVEEKPQTVDESVNARFAFDGTLLKKNDNLSVSSGLYHHGEEPERPGYSLNELLNLMQSTVPSQKVLALETLANVLQNVHKGCYDLAFNGSLQHELFSKTDIVLIARKCLDDSTDTVIAAAIFCLHGLICNTVVDETFMDRVFTWTSCASEITIPELKPSLKDKVEKSKTDEITDSQLVRLDAVLGLLRSDILPRLRYLIDFYITQQNDKVITERILDLLIRIARHSKEAAKSVFDCPYLIETLVNNFLPPCITIQENNVIGNPSFKALKLFRVMLTSDTSLVAKLFASFPQLWHSLQAYVSMDPSEIKQAAKFNKSDALQCSIETLRFWCVLLSHQELIDSGRRFLELFPLILKQLQFCVVLELSSLNAFDWHYCATLLRCITSLSVDFQEHNAFVSVVKTACFQWCRQLVNCLFLPKVDVLSSIAASVDYLVKFNFDDEMIEYVLKPLLVNTSLMAKLCSQLVETSSVLYCNENENARMCRDAKCLPSFHCVYFGGEKLKVNIVLNEDSVLSFFLSLITVLRKTNESSLIDAFTSDVKLHEYITSVLSNFTRFTFNYFESLEIHALASVTLLSTSTTSDTRLYHNLALHVLSSVKSKRVQQELVDNICFNKLFYEQCLNTKMALMQIDDREREDKTFAALELLPTMKTIYCNSSSFDTPLWIYEPIINYFLTNTCSVIIINQVLQYLLILSQFNESFLMNVSPIAVHFGCVSTVFLLSDDIFFEKETTDYLQRLLKKFILLDTTLDCSTESLPHVSTLLNFFELFVTHFEACSYGNATFTNYLLMYLQPKSDVMFRKKLLSDNSYALRAILIPFQELQLNIEKLLFPIETDSAVVESYLRCVLSKIVVPELNKVIYLTIVHHIHHCLFRNTTNLMTINPKMHEKLMRSLRMSTNDRLKSDIINYNNYDLSAKCGFVKTD